MREWDDEENFEFYRSRLTGRSHDAWPDFEKVYQHEAVIEFFSQIAQPPSRVFVYGHSFGSVNKPYFDHLVRSFKDVPWTVCAYNNRALDDVCRALDAYGLGVAYDRHFL